MAKLEHLHDRFDRWARRGPLKRDRLGHFARGNRGGPGRPRNVQAKPDPPFELPGGGIHPFYLIPEKASVMHDNELLHDTQTNVDKLADAKDLWHTLITEALCQGWYGQAWLKLVIQDGTIQQVEAHTQRTKRPTGAGTVRSKPRQSMPDDL